MNHMKRWLAGMIAAMLLMSGGATAEGLISWFLGGDKADEGTGWDDWETAATAAPEASGWDDWEAGLPGVTPSPASAGLRWYDEGGPTVEPEPSPTPADLPESKIEDDGILRVSLRSLDAPQELNLTLDGIYAVEGDRGFRFDKGTRLTLTLMDGDVWLYVGGLNLDMGPSLTLTRHLDGWGEAGGIYIDEAEKSGNLYCGDLSVSAGTFGLQAILTIHVEDYLKGVVAYEMSDSFPLESLKAQAVAARTYALRHKGLSQKRDYDVVDTTADQVFKGFNPEYANVIAAVEETRGVVGTWEGGFANCYYTASNGGQTALASQLWGDDTDDPYLTMREDPYDLENPRSMENDLTFSARCDGSIKLKQMLTAALKPVMEEAGFSEGQWEFDAIADIEPVNPRFEGSLLYDGLAFDVKVRVAESALVTPTPEPSVTPAMDKAPTPEKWVTPEETYRVVLDVFDDIKDGLSLGINGADCELISVEKLPSGSYRLIMRRFGHGVGMSQRGAQTMAGSHEMNYLEILKFYYPGMTLERITWPESPVTALDEKSSPVGASRPRPTPLPTPAPLPKLKDNERYATVDATTLNLRQRPTTASPIEDVYEQGRRVIITGEPDADGWVPCRTTESEGYVKAEYLDIVEAEE